MNRREFIQRSSALAGIACLDAPAFAESLLTLGDPNITIGVISDIHLRGADTTGTFIHTLEYFRSIKVDGVIIAGDMADQGLEPQLQVVADAWFKVFPDNKGQDGKYTEKLFIYGNHDMEGASWIGTEEAMAQAIGRRPAEAWKKCFGEEYAPIWMKTINGYHFIGAHWHTGNIPGLEEFLQKHANELGTEKPFFYIQHPHPKNTCNGKWAWGRDDGTVTRILNNYPNAVAFSGHSHSPLNDDRDLWQEGFTSIGTSSLSYLYPMPARENTYQDDSSLKPPTQMPKMECGDGRQGMIMRVYDQCMTFERREFVYDQLLGDNWILPVPISLSNPLSDENRKRTAPVPQFAADAKATVTQGMGQDRYGTEQQQVTVHFPNILKKDTGVRAFDYEVQVEYDWLDVRFVTATKRVFSPHCCLGEAQDQGEVTCVYGAGELPKDFAYRFAIRPCECFGKKGEPIYTDWIDGSILSLTSTMILGKQFYKTGEDITISYKDAPVGTEAWLGIYAKGKNPGSGSPSYAYQYTKEKEGNLTFNVKDSGEYYAVLFQDSGYTECSPRVPFFVMTSDYDPAAFKMSTSKSVYNVGDAIRVSIAGAPCFSKDWVGIYSANVKKPADEKCPTYRYYNKGTSTLVLNASGSINWTAPLEAGIYFVSYFTSDGYTEPFARQYFAIGKPASLRCESTSYASTEQAVFHYEGLHEHLLGALCYQATGESEWHEMQKLDKPEGSVEAEKLQPGEYDFCICIDGTPVSKTCSVTITKDGTAIGRVPQTEKSTSNMVYRIDGTKVDNNVSQLPRGLYVINGEKVIK